MDGHVTPQDAALMLDEVDRQREQAIRRAVRAALPAWYWWVNAVLVIGFTASFESGRGVLFGIGFAVFVVGQFVSSVLVSRAARAARTHRSLDARRPAGRVLGGIAVFMLVLVGAAMATGLGLKSAGVPYPGTIAAAVGAGVLALGGRTLARAETAFLLRRARSRG